MTKRTIYVYFLRPVGMDGPVKIGCSFDPGARLETYSHWAAFPLEMAASMVGSPIIERRLHGMFADLHSHHEWFRPSPRITAVIEQVAAGTFDVALLDAVTEPSPTWKHRARPLQARQDTGLAISCGHWLRKSRGWPAKPEYESISAAYREFYRLKGAAKASARQTMRAFVQRAKLHYASLSLRAAA